jgi:hypothetical protein
MELILNVEQATDGQGATLTVRLMALNDSYEAVTLDRRLLIGPNVVPEHLAGASLPVSREPSFSKREQNEVVLNPWCFYGRQRTFDGLPAGRVTIYAYLLEQPTDSLLPDRPAVAGIGYQSADAVAIVLAAGG